MSRPRLYNSTRHTPSRLIVPAIYFGSDRVMVGYSLRHEYESEPTRIILKTWHHATTDLPTDSVPPSILIAPDNTLEAFGYEAEKKYKELVDGGRHEKYYYFKNFVSLISNEHSATHLIKDEMGRCMPSLLVLSMAIRCLSNDLEDYLKCKLYSPDKSDFYWVLTVPTMWSLATKELVKSAAEKADIKNDRFTIIADSDAVFHYCRHLSLKTKAGTESDVSRLPLTSGSRYMLIDAESSIRVTAHKITINGQIQEGPLATCGGIELIKSKFDDLMTDIFSNDVYEKFKTAEPASYYELMLYFEERFLRHVRTNDTDFTTIQFPVKLLYMYNDITGETISKIIDSSPYENKVRFRNDKLRVHTEVIVGWFEESIQNTIQQIELMRKDKQFKAIVMIGSLSESTIYQNGIKSTYTDSGIDVIIPQQPSAVVPQGAVMFGHSQESIEQRRPATKLPSMK